MPSRRVCDLWSALAITCMQTPTHTMMRSQTQGTAMRIDTRQMPGPCHERKSWLDACALVCQISIVSVSVCHTNVKMRVAHRSDIEAQILHEQRLCAASRGNLFETPPMVSLSICRLKTVSRLIMHMHLDSPQDHTGEYFHEDPPRKNKSRLQLHLRDSEQFSCRVFVEIFIGAVPWLGQVS
jgi:hypothetical protein